MSNYVIVRINQKLIPEFQINFNKQTNVAKKSSISAWTDIKTNKEELVLILAGQLVYTTKVKIPSKNEEIIRQSIPNAIEEELASDIGQNHYAYEQISNHEFLVSVVKIDILEKINKQLQDAGLESDKLYSEIFTCPFHSKTTSICQFDNQRAIVRDENGGSSINIDTIKNYIKLSTNSKQIIYLSADIKAIDDLKINSKIVDISLLQSNSLIAQDKVNIFQGQYSKDKDNQKTSNPWSKLLLLASILLLSWIIINSYKIWQLASEITTIKSSQATLLNNLVADASQSERNDPYSAFLSRLKMSENSNSTSSSQGFIVSLNYLGKTLLKHPDIQVQSLRQRNNKLEIKLQAQNINQLNQFQLDLGNIAYSFAVKTGTRNSNKKGVSSVITMEQL